MAQIFPYANLILGFLVLILGFFIHWVGQLISFVNWNFAVKVGLQEKVQIAEYKVHEHAIAGADSVMGWMYGLVAIGLILDLSWAYDLIWIPSAIFIYHGIFFWFMVRNQQKLGKTTYTNRFRWSWSALNIFIGLLGILVALSI
jgi:hypothetical protein